MELGISIYPGHSDQKKDAAYLKLASKYGCKHVFTCLLSVEGSREKIIHHFRESIALAHSYDMQVMLDTAPSVFQALGASYDDLSFFKELGADGIRLDECFDSHKEAMMTYNPQGLTIEINAGFGDRYIDNIMCHHPKKDKLSTCFNFYPQRYTGISYDHFRKCAENIKAAGLPVSVFINSQEPDTFGPWQVNDGMCTLEMHRDLPADVAARHFFADGMVDTVIFANCYASEEEFQQVTAADPQVLSFRIEKETELSQTEHKILFEASHFVRGDMSEYMVRSTQPRVTYASLSIPPQNTRDMVPGDVVILNDNYTRYKGELHIILKDLPNDGKKNVIGHIPENEKMLLNYLEPWRTFRFING